MRQCSTIILIALLGAVASVKAQIPSSASPVSAAPTRTEDWTRLPLAESRLNASAFNAVVLGKFDMPGYTRELVRVQWRPDDPIELYVILPKGVVKPKAILYLYDYKSDADRFQNDGWCKRATQGGFAAIGFVSALSGPRFHSPRPMKQWFVSELQESLAASTHDVQMILNYLAVRGDVDAAKAGMIAQGSGGAVAVLAAAADSRIAALDLLDPWGDWPDWLKDSPQVPSGERAEYLKPAFLERVAGLDPVLYLPQLKTRALRVQQIMDDPTTPPSARDKIAAALPRPDDLVRYKDIAAHQSAWRANGLSGWVRAQLQAQTQLASRPDPGAR